MNVIAAVKAYVTKMTEESEPGMKILLMDKETTSIISMVYSQSEIQQKEVFLLERLDSSNNNNGLRYLKCLVFVRPTTDNIQLLCNELRHPKYGAYYVYFSNIIAKADIKLLAEHDEQECVKEVQEFYMDYLAVNPHLFSVGLTAIMNDTLSWNLLSLTRTVNAIIAVLLSLKKCPLIRYQANSKMCKDLGIRIDEVINKESSLFANYNCLLVILDRRDDPMTPLLNQWTYQAMVHELLTINNNRVKIPGGGQFSEVVLSAEQDSFYANNIFKNYGEIGQNIKELMEQFQTRAKNHQKIESIADMKNFVETYPQFKKLSGNISKHVTVVGELSSMVGNYNLLDISEIEQEISSQNNHSTHLQSLKKLFSTNHLQVRDIDLVKLVMLYALRYQNHANNDTAGLIALLRQKHIPEHNLKLIINLIEYAGSHARQSDFFNVENAITSTKRFFKGLSGVDNVYTQHKPLIYETCEDLIKGRLKEHLYPFIGNGTAGNNYKDIIIFMVGGTTFEESLIVHSFNKTNCNLILGGTTIHNSNSFLEQVEQAMRNVPRKYTRNIRGVRFD